MDDDRPFWLEMDDCIPRIDPPLPAFPPPSPPPAPRTRAARRRDNPAGDRRPLAEDDPTFCYPLLLRHGFCSGPDWQDSPWPGQIRQLAGRDGLPLVVRWQPGEGERGCYLAWLACSLAPEPFAADWDATRWQRQLDRQFGPQLAAARAALLAPTRR